LNLFDQHFKLPRPFGVTIDDRENGFAKLQRFGYFFVHIF
jgi:hypothetical protein